MRNTNEILDNVYFVDFCTNTKGFNLDDLYHLPRDSLVSLYDDWLLDVTGLHIWEVMID